MIVYGLSLIVSVHVRAWVTTNLQRSLETLLCAAQISLSASLGECPLRRCFHDYQKRWLMSLSEHDKNMLYFVELVTRHLE